MPDALETTEATTTETAPVETAETTEAVENEWDDPEALPEDQDLFPRTYVEQLRDREAKYRIRARDLHQQVEGFGGVDAVKAAMEMQQSLQTDDGVISMFIESGRALGLGVKELESLFNQSAESTETPTTDLSQLSDDDTVTVAEAKRIFEEMIQRQVLAPQQEQQYQAEVATAQRTVNDALADLKVDPADADEVLRLGQQFIAENDLDPEHIRAAVRKGHEAFETRMRERAEAYLRGKQQTTTAVPASTGASSPGATTLPEPKDAEEGKKRARERLRLAGEAI